MRGQTSLSCKCRIITGLSEEAKPGSLLKIAILKRVIDVLLVNGTEAQSRLAPSPSQKSKGFSGQWRPINVSVVMSGDQEQHLHQRFPVSIWRDLKKVSSKGYLKDSCSISADITPGSALLNSRGPTQTLGGGVNVMQHVRLDS